PEIHCVTAVNPEAEDRHIAERIGKDTGADAGGPRQHEPSPGSGAEVDTAHLSKHFSCPRPGEQKGGVLALGAVNSPPLLTLSLRGGGGGGGGGRRGAARTGGRSFRR